MALLKQKPSWRVLLSWAIILFYILIVGSGTLTAQNDTLNNALHRVLPFWPAVGDSELVTETVTVRKGTFPEAEKRVIRMHTGGQTVTLNDGGVNHLSIRSTYERKADRVYLDTALDEHNTLVIDAKRVLNEIDLPLQPRELASYDLAVGTAELPTYLDLVFLSGEVDMKFEHEPVQTLDFYTESAKAFISFAEGSVPRETIVLESDGGDTTLQLPDINATVKYRLDEDAKLEVNGGDPFRHTEGTLDIKSLTNNNPPLPITVISVEGDVIIATHPLQD